MDKNSEQSKDMAPGGEQIETGVGRNGPNSDGVKARRCDLHQVDDDGVDLTLALGIGSEFDDQDGWGSKHDPLQELMPIVDEDGVSEEEREMIGDLGNDGDDLDGVDALLKEMAGGPPTRMALLMHRVAESLKALSDLRSSPAPAWPAIRAPEEHWRALADEALGLIGDAARKEMKQQKLIQTLPESQRCGFQAFCDSQDGLGVFQKQFDSERQAWERAYWKRALDESFGKSAWQGPAGWRAGQ